MVFKKVTQIGLAAGVLWASYMGVKNILSFKNTNPKLSIERLESKKTIDSLISRVCLINKNIDSLTRNENELKSQLKKAKYENKRIKNSYINSNVNQRIKLFSKLATEKDNNQ